MCGFIGIICLNDEVDELELANASEKIRHRGPDDAGFILSIDKNIAIAHRRLSFIDLSDRGRQPFSNIDNTISVAFNGEIYNYLELRKILIEKGHDFSTDTDTEVLLHGYKEWGTQLPKYLEGMFAMVVYDSFNQKLLLIRDRFGIKPLYYGIFNNAFVFGSEIKALFEFKQVEKNIVKKSVALFLANRYVPTPDTMWENIFKLKPAHILEIDCKTLEYNLEAYWNLDFKNKVLNEKEFTTELELKLLKSVKQHLVSDVEIGTFLSGGMDSSLLVLIMKLNGIKPQAFTIGFNNWMNSEHNYAREVADEMDAELKSIVLDSISLDEVNNLMYYYDDPIADISIIPTYIVSSLAQKSVKAVLSGEGADELFGGYSWHKPQNFHYKTRLSRIKGTLFGNSFNQIKTHYIHSMSMGLFDNTELKEAFEETWHNDIPKDPFLHIDNFKKDKFGTLKQLQYLDINCFMYELVLQKIDKASMANSLEVRVPFLGHNVVEYIFSLNETCYFDNEVQKKPILKMLNKYFKTTIFNRPKQGFVGPDSYYMNYELYGKILKNGMLIDKKIIKRSYVDKLLMNKDHWRLWKLFVLENWWQRNV